MRWEYVLVDALGINISKSTFSKDTSQHVIYLHVTEIEEDPYKISAIKQIH